jgi:hypothetical protein
VKRFKTPPNPNRERIGITIRIVELKCDHCEGDVVLGQWIQKVIDEETGKSFIVHRRCVLEFIDTYTSVEKSSEE